MDSEMQGYKFKKQVYIATVAAMVYNIWLVRVEVFWEKKSCFTACSC